MGIGANLSFILFFFLDCLQPVGIVYYNYNYFLINDIFVCVSQTINIFEPHAFNLD
jgi:hypothetical protein